ncbi:hypothetical protein [uncultured Dokdonia sp.]|uniref:hypothetical protein n=1 Tax=uncultured Dokdonia sp. TaxID=575653 RepID=UPI002608667E|nr:hypothetical protein [uncultured Dokdonia sp.]
MKKQDQNKLHFTTFKVAALGREASISIVGGNKAVANSTKMCVTTTVITDTTVVTNTSAICENEK